MDVIVMLDDNSPVSAEVAEDGIVRVKLGPEPYGVTLVGDLKDLYRVIIEADRQVSRLFNAARAENSSQRG